MIELMPGAVLVAREGCIANLPPHAPNGCDVVLVETGERMTLLSVASVRVRLADGRIVEVRPEAVRLA